MSTEKEKQKFVEWIKERCEVEVDSFFDLITGYMPETIDYLTGLYLEEREEHLQNWKRRAEAAEKYIDFSDFNPEAAEKKYAEYLNALVEHTADMTLPKVWPDKNQIYKL